MRHLGPSGGDEATSREPWGLLPTINTIQGGIHRKLRGFARSFMLYGCCLRRWRRGWLGGPFIIFIRHGALAERARGFRGRCRGPYGIWRQDDAESAAAVRWPRHSHEGIGLEKETWWQRTESTDGRWGRTTDDWKPLEVIQRPCWINDFRFTAYYEPPQLTTCSQQVRIICISAVYYPTIRVGVCGRHGEIVHVRRWNYSSWQGLLIHPCPAVPSDKQL